MKKLTLRKALVRTAGALLIAASLQGASMAGDTGDSTMAKFEPDASFMSAPASSLDEMENTKGGKGYWTVVRYVATADAYIIQNLAWEVAKLEADIKYGVNIGPNPGPKKIVGEWIKTKINKKK